jgi:hypothetical protein
MKSKDEIVDEVREARDTYAARFNYDLAKMCDDIKTKEQTRTNIAEIRPLDPQSNTPASN